MEQAFNDFLMNATTMGKGVFLMVCGICFVFSVQVVFYLIVKLWPRAKAPEDK